MGVHVTVGVRVPISIEVYVEDGEAVSDIIDAAVERSLGCDAEIDGCCDVYSVDCSELPDLDETTIVGEEDDDEDEEDEEEEVKPKKRNKKR
jgi:hypothetical protein